MWTIQILIAVFLTYVFYKFILFKCIKWYLLKKYKTEVSVRYKILPFISLKEVYIRKRGLTVRIEEISLRINKNPKKILFIHVKNVRINKELQGVQNNKASDSGQHGILKLAQFIDLHISKINILIKDDRSPEITFNCKKVHIDASIVQNENKFLMNLTLNEACVAYFIQSFKFSAELELSAYVPFGVAKNKNQLHVNTEKPNEADRILVKAKIKDVKGYLYDRYMVCLSPNFSAITLEYTDRETKLILEEFQVKILPSTSLAAPCAFTGTFIECKHIILHYEENVGKASQVSVTIPDNVDATMNLDLYKNFILGPFPSYMEEMFNTLTRIFMAPDVKKRRNNAPNIKVSVKGRTSIHIKLDYKNRLKFYLQNASFCRKYIIYMYENTISAKYLAIELNGCQLVEKYNFDLGDLREIIIKLSASAIFFPFISIAEIISILKNWL